MICALFVLLSIGGISAATPRSYDDASGVFYLLTRDGQEEFTVDGSVVFKATDKDVIPSYRDNAVTFAPKNEGEFIQATIETIDLDGSTNYLLVYDGYVKTAYSGASDGKDQSTFHVPGWVYKLSASDAGKVVASTAADGKLTFGFHSTSQLSQKGFTIKVSAVKKSPMVFESVSGFGATKQITRGVRNVILGGVNVKTDGSLDALQLTALKIDVSGLDGKKVSNVRLFSNENLSNESLVAMAADGSLELPKAYTLAYGNNKFFVVADVDVDAVGSLGTFKIEQVKVADDAKTITDATPEAAVCDNVILMTATNKVFTISGNATFFDDGGENGKISAKFNGSITFVPSSANKKIKVEFEKLAIFNTSSTGYNDVFSFYNGRSAESGNLITTILKDMEIVKSSAEDGSMTVTLVSTTGIPADGWKAIVSEYEPGNMTFSEVKTSALDADAAVCAGEKDAKFLLLNVRTENNMNPLSLKALAFEAATPINKVKVYYLGKNDTFSTSNLFGEGDLKNLTISGAQELIEGNNYFAIVADIDDSATTGTKASLTLKSYQVGEASSELNPAVSATRDINNVYRAVAGTNEVKLYGPWTFTHTHASSYSDKYLASQENHIVSFVPTTAGSVAQIDFESFDVYYTSSSYGTKAVFEIYSGRDMTEDNLLWKVDSSTKAKEGPGKLRSKSADGILTVKFNPNTSYSSYTGNGWLATVSEYANTEMVIKSIETRQTSTADLGVGAKNQSLIDFNVVAEGTLTLQQVKEIKLDMKSSLAAIEKVSVLYSGNEDDITKAVEFGSAELSDNASVTITGNRALSEDANHFWVVVDAKPSFASDIKVDAKLESITTDKGTFTPADGGDPEGERLSKNMVFLNNGDNVTITVTDPVMFYDDGGANGEYSKNISGQYTFIPSGEGNVIRLLFKEFKTNSSHPLCVYNGKEVKDENLVGKYSWTTYPEYIVSKSEDGAITVSFTSTSASTYAGWAIEVSNYVPKQLAVSEVKVEPASSVETVVRGASNVALARVALKLSGDKGVVDVKSFKGVSSNMAATKVFYTGTSTGYIDNVQFGEAATANDWTVTATTPLTIDNEGTYYFWLAGDFAKSLAADTEVSVNLSSLNEETVTADAVTRKVKAGFSGNYTIGAGEGADYATFADAVKAIGDAVEGPVKFSVQAGTYAEQVILKNIAGTSAENTITFESATGNADDVVLAGDKYSDPGYGGQKYGVFAVDATPYVVLRSISVIPTDQSYPYAVHVLNASRHFTIENCVLTADPVNSGYSGMNMVYTYPAKTMGGNNDYITIKNNKITGGYIGLYLYGDGALVNPNEVGAYVSGNTIANCGSKGIYLSDQDDFVVENNIISTVTQKTGYNGIDFNRGGRNGAVIRNNRIENNQSVYSTGIYMRYGVDGGSVETPVRIYNNVIAISKSPNASSQGITTTGDNNNIVMEYNSVSVSGTAGYPFGFYNSAKTMKNVVLRNNLLQTTTSTPVFAGQSAQLPLIKYENNAYYTAGEKFTLNGSATFDEWKTAMGDNSSIVEKADFFSTTDLHLKSLGNLAMAAPVADITTDLDGKARNAEKPTVGAYEYEDVVVEKPAIAEGYPTVTSITDNSAKVNVKWNQSGVLHYSNVKAGAEAPTAETLLASVATVSVSKDAETSISLSSLEEKTEYVCYMILAGSLGENSDVVKTAPFTTLKTILPLSAEIDIDYQTVAAGTEVTIAPTVSGGEAPYTYSWTDRMGVEVCKAAQYKVAPETSQEYKITVTSADKQTATVFTQITVTGNSAVATFEDNALDSESYWRGRDYSDEMQTKFFSGSYAFENTYMPEYSYWGGFAYSNVTETAFDNSEMMTHQFRSVTGKGVKDSNTFGIMYIYTPASIDVLGSADGDVVKGVYVTNSAYTKNSMLNGDGYADKFASGDYFKLEFTGDANESVVEFYLADYRSSNEDERYIINDWRYVDLSSLGKIKKLNVAIKASNNKVPTYACFDNLGDDGVESGVERSSFADGLNIYPVPAEDVLNVAGIEGDYSLRIYSASGVLVYRSESENGAAAVDVASLPAGSYLLEIVSDNQRTVKQFLKK